MPRYYEIETAFRAAVKIAESGWRTVTTVDFVAKLGSRNWHWDLKRANEWIENSVSTFKDVSTEEGEERTFMVFNPNGGL